MATKYIFYESSAIGDDDQHICERERKCKWTF